MLGDGVGETVNVCNGKLWRPGKPGVARCGKCDAAARRNRARIDREQSP